MAEFNNKYKSKSSKPVLRFLFCGTTTTSCGRNTRTQHRTCKNQAERGTLKMPLCSDKNASY